MNGSKAVKNYLGSDIRNVAVVGHSHSGKTTLIAALLHAAGVTERPGRVEDGSAVTAYDEEEVARRTTMSAAVAFAEWDGVKVNLVDTPGFHMFTHEAKAALLPVEAALLVVNASTGVETVTKRMWGCAEEFRLPRVLVVNQMDHARADGEAVLEALKENFGRQVTAVQLPIVESGSFRGVVDLVKMEAFFYEPDGNGRGKKGDIPEDLKAAAQAAHEALVELVAEGKDELMEEFFREGTIPVDHLVGALHEAIREDRIFPVLYASGGRGVGMDCLLSFLKVYAPAATEREPVTGHSGEASEADGATQVVTRKVDDSEPLSLFVFKTMTDPFAGRISFFKVFSGVLKNDASVTNYSRGGTERFAHLSAMQGHTAAAVNELHAGDIGAAPKLKETFTGDTLGAAGQPIRITPVAMPEAAMTYAIEPKTRADEDKLAAAMHKLMEEDQMVRFFRDEQTHEFLIAGAGQQHIEALVSKLKRRYHTEVTLKAPKVAYRETIRASAEAQGRHKKQTGGHGQFGDCKIRIEPLERGAGFEFVNDIFGGAIPRGFIPAVEKGIQETAARGYLAGYPVVDFKVTLFDGSYHEVDSNELSFKLAGRLAFRKCMEQARPTLLEPIMKVEIEAPEEFAGALMGDLNSRRGRVQGMEGSGGTCVIRSEVPMAEMLTYGATLTALTQGRGTYHMEMAHYDMVPAAVAEKIVASAKRPVDTDEAA
jgi:elongation factor G